MKLHVTHEEYAALARLHRKYADQATQVTDRVAMSIPYIIDIAVLLNMTSQDLFDHGFEPIEVVVDEAKERWSD